MEQEEDTHLGSLDEAMEHAYLDALLANKEVGGVRVQGLVEGGDAREQRDGGGQNGHQDGEGRVQGLSEGGEAREQRDRAGQQVVQAGGEPGYEMEVVEECTAGVREDIRIKYCPGAYDIILPIFSKASDKPQDNKLYNVSDQAEQSVHFVGTVQCVQPSMEHITGSALG